MVETSSFKRGLWNARIFLYDELGDYVLLEKGHESLEFHSKDLNDLIKILEELKKYV